MMWKLLLIGQLLVACLPNAKSSIEGNNDLITITGRVTDTQGDVLQGVEMFLASSETVSAVTESDGRYTIRLSSEDIRVLRNQLTAASSGEYRIYFKDPSSGRVAISESINIGERGEIAIEDITLRDGVDLEGKVSFIDRDTGSIPGEGATISLDRWVVKADEEGLFSLEDIPAGSLNLRVDAISYTSIEINIQTDGPGVDDTLDNIVLFRDQGISGAILIDDAARQRQGPDPLVKSLSIKYSSNASLVRISENIRELQFQDEEDIVIIDPNSEESIGTVVLEQAKWLPIARQLSYAFDSVGAKTLYYQFANQAESETSEIYSIDFVVDVFQEGAVQINSGDATTEASLVQVQFQIPDGATGIKIAEAEDDLAGAPVLAATEQIDYQLSGGPANDLRTLFIQFTDNSGNSSLIYSDSIQLSLFPANLQNGFSYSIANVTQTSMDVNFNIAVPPQATEYRIFESILSETFNPPWNNVEPIFSYTTVGTYNRYVYFQFRDEYDNESELIQYLITRD